MTAEEIRKVKVTYCDYCSRELHTPYSTIVNGSGVELDFCSDYKDGEENCLQKYKRDGKTITHAAQQSKMPTEEEIRAAASAYEDGVSAGYAVKDELSGFYRNDDFIAGVEWLRNQIEK